MEKISRTVVSRILDALRDKILLGEFKPCEPLRQVEIAESLGVSRIPLREALIQLEQEGLVVNAAYRGYEVRDTSLDELEELYNLRGQLEPDAVARACLSHSKQDLKNVAGTIDALEKAMKQKDARGMYTLNRLFHRALYLPGSRSMTIEFLDKLHVLSERYTRLHLNLLGNPKRAVQEHRAIFDAWRNRRVSQCAALTKDHISDTYADLKRALELSKQATH